MAKLGSKASNDRWSAPPETAHAIRELGRKVREAKGEIRPPTPVVETPDVSDDEFLTDDDEDGLPKGVCAPSATRKAGSLALDFHAGVRGRREFFRISKNAHARPADAAAVQEWVDADAEALRSKLAEKPSKGAVRGVERKTGSGPDAPYDEDGYIC